MPTPPLTDDELRKTLETLAAHGGKTGPAAEALGVSRSALYNRLARASLRGLGGDTPRPVPAGQVIKGVSTLSDRNGQVAATWVKTRAEALPLIDVVDAIREALADHRAAPAPVPDPVPQGADDLLALFLLPDFHLGMNAWGAETGEDYDLAIAESLARGAFADLVRRAPPAGEAVILGLGDFTHADDESATTRRSGNHLDVDTRHGKVLKVAIRLLVWKIDLALTRFPTVRVRILKGNHDEQTAAAITAALALFYEVNPRVIVDESPSLWWWHRHGRVLLGATHGHTCKPDDMPGVMASDCAADWGKSVWRYMHHGHWHHKRATERMGVMVEGHRSPAAKDAYHAGGPYRSARSLAVVTYHKARGETARDTVNIPSGRDHQGVVNE